MSFVYILLFIISVFWIKTFYKTLFVPMTIISVCWCVFPAIACTGVLGLYPLVAETHMCIMLSYITFLSVSAILSSKMKKISGFDNNSYDLDGKVNNVNYLLLFLGNLIISLWLLTKLGQTLSVIREHGFVYLRYIHQDNFSSSTIVNVIYNWFAKPFVVASCAIFSIDIMQKRNKQQIWVGLIILVNVLLDTIIFAARATIVKLVIYFFFSMFFCKKREYTKKQKMLVAMLVAVLMIVIVFMTGERMSVSYSSFSFLDSISMYYVAPFGLLNYYIENPIFSRLSFDGLTFGSGMFGAIYNIFWSALYVVFGVEYHGSDNYIQLVTQHSIRVGEKVSLNSACTADYIFLRDAGFLGIIIGFALIAFLVEKSRNSYERLPSVRNGAIYISLLYVTFRLSMSYDFLTPSTFFSILYIFLCTLKPMIKFRLVRKK